VSVLEDVFYGAGWDESQHPRVPGGGTKGGQFAPKRLYRGEGERTIPTAELPGGGKSTKGRYFTDDPATADMYARSQGGQVYYVDLTDEERAALGPRRIQVGKLGGEYLVDRKTADRMVPLEARLSAAGWDESKHPRDPGGEGGGQWISVGGEDIEVKPDTPQQARILKTNKTARKVRERYGPGTRVGSVGGPDGEIKATGTVIRHVPGGNAQGGYLVVRWDNGQEGRIGPIAVKVLEDETPWEDKAWVDPPKPRGIHAGIGGAGGYTTDRAETTLTEMGREGEALFREIAGESKLMHEPGKGEQSPLDVQVGDWGFEVKSVDADSTSFKATPKKHKLKPAIAIVVIDRKAGFARAYYREGLKGGRLSKNTGWQYMGETKLKVTAAAWDESEHPRYPAGDPHGGRWRRKADALFGLEFDPHEKDPARGTAAWYYQKMNEFFTEPDRRMEFAEEVPVEEAAKYMEYDRVTGPPGEQAVDAQEMSALRKHMQDHGMSMPIFIDYNEKTGEGHISEGHHRLEIARYLGWPTVPVLVYPSTRTGKRNVPMGRFQGEYLNAYMMEKHGEAPRLPDYIPPSQFGIPTAGPSSKAATAAGFDESKHPRDPGGEGGGQFVRKGTVAADEIDPKIWDDPTMQQAVKQARQIVAQNAASKIRLPKFAEAKALQNRLYEIGADDELGKWVLDDWGEWTDEQQRELKAYLDKQLQEGGWEKVWAENLHPPREISRRIQSGLLSVDYSKEIGMSYSKERGQARSLVSALEKHIAYNEAIKYGFDPAEYAADLFGEEAIAARRKKPNISPRDQGIPEEYLSEKGTFKPGHDAKLKSDLVNSYFELDPKKQVSASGEVKSETRRAAVDLWKSHQRDSALIGPDGLPYGDDEMWQIALRDIRDPSQWERYQPMARQIEHETRTRTSLESTLIHRFDPKDAQRILEERGWTKFLDQKRDKLRGMLERTPEQANGFIPGLGDQVRSELDRAHAVWGDSLNVKGERFGLVQAQVGELAHLEPQVAQGLVDAGVKIHVGPGPSTDLDEMWHLSDERARGWGNTYLDKVGGFYSPTSRSVIVSATAPSSTSGLMAHEVGHAIGDVYKIDSHPELADHHHRVYNQVRSYFKQGGKGSFAGKQELWAEGVSAVLRNRMEGEFDRRVVQKGQKDTGPFIERDYDSLSPEAKEYLDWVDRTLREIAEGRHVAA
jgi:hypothetical protein